MRILIACETSGAVRRAFRALGHDAWSCDLLPADDGGEHRQDDAWRVAEEDDWDLMIAHPPCTHLSVSGARWFKDKREQQEQAVWLFKSLASMDHIPRIAIENPIGIMSTRWRKPDQIIQPWQFGEDASKATCLWLKGLPPLVPTDVLPGGRTARRANQTPSGQNRLGPSPDRWKLRSKTYDGIAIAMADQWGKALLTPCQLPLQVSY